MLIAHGRFAIHSGVLDKYGDIKPPNRWGNPMKVFREWAEAFSLYCFHMLHFQDRFLMCVAEDYAHYTRGRRLGR